MSETKNRVYRKLEFPCKDIERLLCASNAVANFDRKKASEVVCTYNVDRSIFFFSLSFSLRVSLVFVSLRGLSFALDAKMNSDGFDVCSMDLESLTALYSLNESLRPINWTAEETADFDLTRCSLDRLDRIIKWLVPVIFAIIFVVGILGNVLVLGVVLFKQQMRNTTNVLILVIFIRVCIC